MSSVKNREFRCCLCTFVASSETEFDSHIECSHSDIFNATFNQNGMSDPSKEHADELKNQESDLQVKLLPEQHQQVQVQTNQKEAKGEDEKSHDTDFAVPLENQTTQKKIDPDLNSSTVYGEKLKFLGKKCIILKNL